MDEGQRRIVLSTEGLDVPQTLDLAVQLNDKIGWIKISTALALQEGFSLTKRIRKHSPNTKVLLDLKLYEEPQYLKDSIKAALTFQPDMLTILLTDNLNTLQEALTQGIESGTDIAAHVPESNFKSNNQNIYKLYKLNNPICVNPQNTRETRCYVIHTHYNLVNELSTHMPLFLFMAYGLEQNLPSPDLQTTLHSIQQTFMQGSDYICIGPSISSNPKPIEAAEAISEIINKTLRAPKT